jgi:hypothetical protein
VKTRSLGFMVNLQNSKATFEAYAMCKPRKLKTYQKKHLKKNITKVMKSTNETQTKKNKEKIYICHISRNKLQAIMLKNAIAIKVEVFTFTEFQSRKTRVML